MDTKVTIQQLKDQVQQFCEERDWDQYHTAKDLAIGAATESAELLEIFRFRKDGEDFVMNSQAERQQVADELADVMFFVVRLAQKYQFDLADIFAAKLEKNRQKYPVDKARGSNKKYTEL